MMLRLALMLCLLLAPSLARAEDGYDLWLRYRPVEASWQSHYEARALAIVSNNETATLKAAREELQRGLKGLLSREVPLGKAVGPGAIVIGTPASSRGVASLRLPLSSLGDEGYLIRSIQLGGRPVTVIAANRDIGVLYGTFAFLRLIQTRQPLDRLDIRSTPKLHLRLLNHWDNLDRTVERGYSGLSIWDWATLPELGQRYIDYARANASIGINGTVLNNVNANAQILRPDYLRKVKALADVFRPYGIRVYLTARFSAPVEIGGLRTADPLDPAVRAWWTTRTAEIYRLVPDFGGFLVKANSEGQPGPQDYGRSHADGANMLADALAPHGGTVFWRAFVYGGSDDDRAKQAYDQFRPLDGKFRDNVILQVKNGPIDFQPREPFHPLFGQMPHTKVGLELQITREYLSQNSGIVYLGPMWAEVLDADTCSPRCGTPVSSTIMAIAGVSNVGTDRNWTGTNFDQANWYAFGRLAWDPHLSPAAIAADWTRMTWSENPRVVRSIVDMMMRSREAAVDYMTPLGLAHLFAEGDHYGPGPWECADPPAPGNPCYYHRADANGIGFNRTPTGSNAIAQYAPEVAKSYGDVRTVPENLLLWFHRVRWTHRMRSGRTLWEELIHHYDRGVAQVEAMRRQWERLKPAVDPQRHCEVAASLGHQEIEARRWRDASIVYWQSLSKLPLPKGVQPPEHPLQWYVERRLKPVPGSVRIERCSSASAARSDAVRGAAL